MWVVRLKGITTLDRLQVTTVIPWDKLALGPGGAAFGPLVTEIRLKRANRRKVRLASHTRGHTRKLWNVALRGWGYEAWFDSTETDSSFFS